MSDLAAFLIAALRKDTEAAAGKPTQPVSIQIDWISDGPCSDNQSGDIQSGDIKVAITRVTKTLVFATAESTAGGRKTAHAAAVFKIASPAA